VGHKRNTEDKRRAQGNPVAKHMRTFNKAHVFQDKKQKSLKGHRKHKGEAYE